MASHIYRSMESRFHLNRRNFVKTAAGAVGAGLVLGNPLAWAQDKEKHQSPSKPATNIDEILKIPRTESSMPGVFPGRVVEIRDADAVRDNYFDPEIIQQMFNTGLEKLTDLLSAESFGQFFTPDDVIGLKVNPVGPGLIATRLELVDAIIEWLITSGVPRENIIIWDRFDYMLTQAGFTKERFPGIGIVGLQTMDESAFEEGAEDRELWKGSDGDHISARNFDPDVFYWADIEAPQDDGYLHQHVFNDKKSYFGKLVTQKLTKIINLPVLKNTGNGISVATKNLGYGAICNTGRLHRPLFFDVCTEVLAFPALRDKVVLNIADGLRGQYDGGPMPAPQFAWDARRLYFSTDAIAMDMICHYDLMARRKEMKISVDEHPRYTEYLRYAERIGLGVAAKDKIEHIVIG